MLIKVYLSFKVLTNFKCLYIVPELILNFTKKQSRNMNLTTAVNVAKPNFQIEYKTPIVTIGSCFSDNIGQQLTRHQFKILQNPFGVLYNPSSIASCLKEVINEKQIMESELTYFNQMYHYMMRHGQFSANSSYNCLQNINNNLVESSLFLKNASLLIITWGTAWVYRYKENNQIVANCHKLPARFFNRERLSISQIISDWNQLLEMLWEINPSIHILMTISPIRHWKDGAHENQVSKSILFAALDELQQTYPTKISYFPAYEIMMDELRDYRFYADDLLHPSSLAIKLIWQRFTDYIMMPDTKMLMKQINEITKRLEHRPSNEKSLAYKQFLTQTLFLIEQVNSKLPYLCFSDEDELIRSKLIYFES